MPLSSRCLFMAISICTRDVPRVMTECGLLIGGVLLILGVALGFTNYLVDAQNPRINWLTGRCFTSSRSGSSSCGLNVILIITVGGLIEIYAAIVVVVPLLVPIGVRMGDRSGAFGHHLSRQHGIGIPGSSGGVEFAAFLVSLQKTGRRGDRGGTADAGSSLCRGIVDHLLPSVDDLPPGPLRQAVGKKATM